MGNCMAAPAELSAIVLDCILRSQEAPSASGGSAHRHIDPRRSHCRPEPAIPGSSVSVSGGARFYPYHHVV